MNSPTVYDEIVDFLAMGSTPAQIIAFQVSEETRDRVSDLLHREKTLGLTLEENTELDHYLQLEHIMRLAKARARKHIAYE